MKPPDVDDVVREAVEQAIAEDTSMPEYVKRKTEESKDKAVLNEWPEIVLPGDDTVKH